MPVQGALGALAGGAAAAVKRNRRIFGSASAPALPGVKERVDEVRVGKTKTLPEQVEKGKSPGTTPRTPRSVEVCVEGHEVSVPEGVWAPDGSLEAPLSGSGGGAAQCSLTIKAGLSGRTGVHVVLRVGLKVDEERMRFAATPEGLGSWVSAQASGAEECDIGRLGTPRNNSSPRVPQPGSFQHDWSEAVDPGSRPAKGSGELSAEEALSLGPNACRAKFSCRLSLHIGATCTLLEDGQARLRVEVSGTFSLRPWFEATGREATQRLYRAAREAFAAGQDEVARLRCEEAIRMVEGLDERPRELGDVFNLLGALHLRAGAPNTAVDFLQRALEFREREHGTGKDVTMAATLGTLGSAHQALGAFGEAAKCHERAVAILEQAGGGPALASSLHSLGSARRALGLHDEARRCYEASLRLRQQAFGESHALCAATLNNLGAVLQQLLRHRDAIGCYQRALAIEARVYGREHPATAATLSNLGSAHGHVGEHKCAVDCLNRALSLQEAALGPEHPSVATTLHNLGNSLAAAGHGQDAARCLWRALAIWSKALGPAHPDIAATLHSLGNVYRGLEEPEAAAKCFSGALRIREVALGPTHPETARTRHCAALAGCRLGNVPAALQELQAAVNSLLGSLGSEHPWSLQARADAESLGQVLEG